MQLLVTTLQGNTITIQVESSDTIRLVKGQIRLQTATETENQRLLYAGDELNDGRTLDSYSIRNLAKLHMVERVRGEMQIFVNTSGGRTISITVERNETIGSVKTKIYLKEGLPAHQQTLVYGGKPLQDEITLQEYNISKDATLHLALRVKGGLGDTFM
ncbi:hypothetical protein RCL1_006571 [Eukaryota sp. TZLM3-RCL]